MAKRVSPQKANFHNSYKWPISLKNKARQDPGLREHDTINPSHRPAVVKASKEYVKNAVASKSKDTETSNRALRAGNRNAEFIAGNGGMPSAAYKKLDKLGTDHGSWEGIYTPNGSGRNNGK